MKRTAVMVSALSLLVFSLVSPPAFSNDRAPAVTVYPDSDKIGVWPGDEANALIFKRSTAVPYSEGEEGWENAS